jgi:hypothetical protein
MSHDAPPPDDDPVHVLSELCKLMLPLVKEAVHNWSEEQRSLFRQEELGTEALGELIENLKLVQDKMAREKHLYGHSETEERYKQLGDASLQRLRDAGMVE